jgi:carbonic anhydrase
MERLIPVTSAEEILPEYRETPVGELLEYHNLERPLEMPPQPRMLVGMCMDYRKHLRIPENFAFIIRTGGANLRYSEFKVSYAIGVGGVTTIALIGHTNCGMVNIMARKETFVRNLATNAGWTEQEADEHFMTFAPMFEIGNEIDFVLGEAARLRLRYPRVTVAPLIYRVEDNRLYHVREA